MVSMSIMIKNIYQAHPHLQFEITIRTEVELPQCFVVAVVPVVGVAEDPEVGGGDLSPYHCVLEFCCFRHDEKTIAGSITVSYHSYSLLSDVYIFSCS